MGCSGIIKRTAKSSALLLLSTVLVAGCGVVGIDNGYVDSVEPATHEPTTHNIEIKGFQFSQAALSVQPGDTITWTNLDIVPHTATSNDKSWTSPELKTGESYTLDVSNDTFEGYFCLYHPSMVATLKIAAE